MPDDQIYLAHQFETVEQQKETDTIGMWTFLATEILFFGAVLTAFIVYRTLYHQAFADGNRYMEIAIGGINTAVLLTSSLMMALAVHAAQLGERRSITIFLLATIILGFVFLILKGYEYYHHWEDHLVPGLNFHFAGSDPAHTELYFLLYFILTGLHAIHMTIGEGILITLLIMNLRGKFSAGYHAPVEISGLYWHFIDIVWIFLYPLLYLIDIR